MFSTKSSVIEILDAAVQNSNVSEDILDEKNTSCDVYADSAYRSAEHEVDLRAEKFRPHLQGNGMDRFCTLIQENA